MRVGMPRVCTLVLFIVLVLLLASVQHMIIHVTNLYQFFFLIIIYKTALLTSVTVVAILVGHKIHLSEPFAVQ